MRRIELIEIHDHPRFPDHLRNLFTDALQALWELGNSYGPITSLLHDALASAGTVEVLDLCSGGGGPWQRLAEKLEQAFRLPVRVRLSDRYPNLEAFKRARLRSNSKIGSISQPVDALHVPATLSGFRTMFSSFHHFGPANARRVLHDAMEDGRGIGIFEVPGRNVKTVLLVCMTPLMVLWLTPRIRPFCWSRLFWTYVVPVIPLAIGFDGLISCLRAYAPEELEEMVAELKGASPKEHYLWKVGEERGGMLPISYIIGLPLRSGEDASEIPASSGFTRSPTEEQYV
ncbi:hypothetical protein [Granulicella sp. dw_53]|uniref:hypothetical protein n=1 Tax=Granulicella sp. dw_53 TaxID=2719792 RepID=UPI001BD4EDD7|nr:hypothetical protein [Granulicella sp. dw_53]